MVTGSSGGYNIEVGPMAQQKGRVETSCWNRRTKTEKCLTVWCIFTVLLLLFFMIMYFLLITGTYNFLGLIITNPIDLKCVTEQCKTRSADMKHSMDPSIDPCTDFYQYACGKFDDGIIDSSIQSRIQAETQDEIISYLTDLSIDLESSPVGNRKVRSYFESCMNAKSSTDGRQEIMDYLQKENMIIYTKASWNLTDYDITDDLIKLHQLLENPLFILNVDICISNSSKYQMQMDTCQSMSMGQLEKTSKTAPNFDDPPSLNSDEALIMNNTGDTNGTTIGINETTTDTNETTTSEGDNSTTTQAPKVVTTEAPQTTTTEDPLIGTLDNNMTLTEIHEKYQEEKLNKTIEEIIGFLKDVYFKDSNSTDLDFTGVEAFLKDLDKLKPSESECESMDTYYTDRKDYTVEELEKAVPKINWKKFFNATLGQLPTTLTVDVHFPGFLEQLQTVLESSQPMHIHNSLVSMFIQNKLKTLASPKNENRNVDCYGYVKLLMPEVISDMYVRQGSMSYFKELRSKVEKIKKLVEKSMVDRIRGSSWMDMATKERLTRKVENLNATMIAPRYDFYENSLKDVSFSGNFIEDTLMLFQRRSKKMFGLLDGGAVDVEDYLWRNVEYPFKTSVSYQPHLNRFDLTYGFANEPLFGSDVPMYLNFGAIGSTIAHEMGHVISGIGFYFDEFGLFNESMMQKPYESMKRQEECFINQYSSMSQSVTHDRLIDYEVPVNGSRTLYENMADVIGIKHAIESYRDWLKEAVKNKRKGLHDGIEKHLEDFKDMTSEQMFFLSAAQAFCKNYSPLDTLIRSKVSSHTLANHRVNGMMMNSREFASVYQCERGSKMNPYRKCSFI